MWVLLVRKKRPERKTNKRPSPNESLLHRTIKYRPINNFTFETKSILCYILHGKNKYF